MAGPQNNELELNKTCKQNNQEHKGSSLSIRRLNGWDKRAYRTNIIRNDTGITCEINFDSDVKYCSITFRFGHSIRFRFPCKHLNRQQRTGNRFMTLCHIYNSPEEWVYRLTRQLSGNDRKKLDI
ncbi:hypothetical protein GWI33_013602 [Rhynchophorus ferrugineus]|uniref:Uncharacterized protein n=1 Tax=Rhynchophorus ferrugineus TaxID=354439 RepID=A0A834I4B0_RHYFE|nr:hypothetical protein GWI33_013602 [Rhynchophorus ferrugineus]